MKLRTELEHKPLSQLIAPNHGLFMVGSCFTEHIGSWLGSLFLPICCNPWGVLFNPASIALSVGRLIAPTHTEFTLYEREGRFYSFLHHGQFAGANQTQVQQHLQEAEAKALQAWNSSRHVLVTWGTAWVFEYEGQVVANCHKFPASNFVRRYLTVHEIVELWQPLIEASNGKHFIFTVSPIRHLADGLSGNQLSKATLLLAIHELCLRFPEQVEYLPVYELFVDDLRDYRFYADDLVHPSSLGIEAVRELVSDCCFTSQTKAFIAQMLPISKALQHRSSDPDSAAHLAFVEQQLQKKAQLLSKFNMV